MDETHDPARTSWVPSAQGHPDFPIQNLPFGIFHRVDDKDDPSPARVGMAIGDFVLDLTACHDLGWFRGVADRAGTALAAPALNALMALGPATWRAVRRAGQRILASDSPAYHANRRIGDHILVPMAEAELLLPAAVGDYTDFYASIHHATNVGGMFRPDNPLLPNYKWVPIGYHGRASSLVPSGTPVRRPSGQIKDPKADAPAYGPTRALDYEMEVGCFVGTANPLGTPVPIAEAEAQQVRLGLVDGHRRAERVARSPRNSPPPSRSRARGVGPKAGASALGSLICPLGRRTGVPLGTSDDARPWYADGHPLVVGQQRVVRAEHAADVGRVMDGGVEVGVVAHRGGEQQLRLGHGDENVVPDPAVGVVGGRVAREDGAGLAADGAPGRGAERHECVECRRRERGRRRGLRHP